MHFAGAPSWELREDATHSILVALYVRDALGIDEPDELPRLLPSVDPITHAHPGRARAVLEQQWMWWWRSTVDPVRHPSTSPLELVAADEGLRGIALPAAGFGELRETLLAIGGSAGNWAAQQHRRYGRVAMGMMLDRAFTVQHLVREREAEMGRAAENFRLTVEVLPFAQPGLWWIGASTIAVSESVRIDEEAYGEALRPVIRRLA
ncbi:hypothetical protein BH11ACT4_BH11ACT4_06530 [soil metagenome]